MKRTTHLYTAVGALLMCILATSCKKDADMKMYDKNLSAIYFGLPFKLNQFGNPAAEREDSMFYTFAYELPDVQQYTFKVPVWISGMSATEDREFTIEIDKENTTADPTDYVAIPAKQIIHAGKSVDTISVTVNKTAALNISYKHIVFRLVANPNFKLGTKEYLSAKLSFTNILSKPTWWNTWQNVFGLYSKEKYQIWINTYKKGLDPTPDLYDKTKTYFYYWDNMPQFSTYPSWFPVTFMYVKYMKDYLIANPTYVDNDPTKERVLLP